MSTEGNKMETSPAAFSASIASAEASPSIRDVATSASGGTSTQPDLALVQEASQRLHAITSTNDNSDVETSAVTKADSEAESVTTHGSQYSDAQTGITPIRRANGGVHSDPIESPGRMDGAGNGIDHAATSPARGAVGQITPVRPLNTGRLQLGPDTTLATPVELPRVVSPTFRRLMSPGSIMDHSSNLSHPRPSVSPVTAGLVSPTTSDIQTDRDGFSIFEEDSPDFDASSIVSGHGGGERVVQITSPSDGITLPVAFPENTTGAARDRGTGTVHGHRGPRMTRAVATHRPHNLRDTATLSSSVTSLMPRSSHGSTRSSDHEEKAQEQAQEQTQEKGQKQGQSQEQAQTQELAQGRFARVRGPGTVSYGPRRPIPRIRTRQVSKIQHPKVPTYHIHYEQVLTSRQDSTSSESPHVPRARDLERQPLITTGSRRHRSYGTIMVRNIEEDNRDGNIGFLHRFTPSEMILFIMFLIAASFGFLVMIMVMIHLMHV
ncbi:hypothetical protein F5B19DRAFT_437605 [Rostrohypoxylon terebratum]|nr:hypothetical protein F5B19DRAFT_437605 [Rostrohypoxylon terebratum]